MYCFADLSKSKKTGMANPETRLTDNWFVIGTTSRTTGYKLVLKT